jgi:hypothetical protein
MQTLKIVDRSNDHIIVSTDGPARFEIGLVDGRLMLHGYEGSETDLEQDPTVVYDGTNADLMEATR